MRQRSIVIEFDSYELALACYRSPACQAIIPLREGAGYGRSRRGGGS